MATEQAAGVLTGRLALAAAIAAPVVLAAGWKFTRLGAFALASALHAPLLAGTLRANSQLFGPVSTRFVPAPASRREVWLTIDDGPSPADTPRILDLLDAAAGAKATFFVRGDHARAHPDLIQEIQRRGHQLGNHTFSHPQASFWCLPRAWVAREIADCSAALREITGEAPRLFRAPVGMANPGVHREAAAQGLRMIGWSARGYDGVIARAAHPARVVARIRESLRPGAIVLLHEGRVGRNGEALNVRALQLLLAKFAAEDWQCVLPEPHQLQ